MSNSDSILEVRDLVTSFDTDAGRMTAVDGVSFSVTRGKTLGIVGESGCGKSVTAFSITRLLPQPHGKIRGGSILFEGRELTTMPLEEMQRLRGNDISMIFQEPMTALNPVQTVGRQIAEAILLHEKCSKREVLERSVDMLKKVRIPAPESRLHEYPHQLSGGMKQRVMIAMALINKPKLLIADEPTTALDVTVQAQILELIAELQQEMGMSVILITHDLGVIAEVCDEVVVMYAGRVVERAGVHQLFASPRHAYTRGLLECLPRLDRVPKTRLQVIPGSVPSLENLLPGCRFAERAGKPHTEAQLKVRPDLVELSPNHWVENCPVCAGLEIAILPAEPSLGQTPPDSHHDHESRRTAQSALESAQSYLRAGQGTSPPPSGRAARQVERNRQLELLAARSAREGALIDGSLFELLVAEGSEHRVILLGDEARAWKATLPGRAGNAYPAGSLDGALPGEYLERWRLHNEVFGDEARLEGMILASEGVSLVISQPWIVGNRSTPEAISAYMKDLGFAHAPNGVDFYRQADELAALDCYEDNYILGENGQIYPVDVHLVHADAALKKAIGFA